MFKGRSLKLPITLGVLMIVVVIALTVGWILLAAPGVRDDSGWSALYWILLTVGTVFLAFVLVGVVMYLTLSVEAINLNRRQSNFIDSVTHELKSPIASLKLYVQTLSRRQVSRQEQEQFCRYMLDDVERLDQLINHLLDAARLGDGVAERDVEEIDLARMLAHCVEEVTLRYRVPAEIVELDVQSVIVRSRPVDLDVVFRNLIDNAVKYAGDAPQVWVKLRQRDGQAVVQITDNGKGIPPSLRRKVFGRFFRVGDELEREKPGTGLGLYIVRTLVRRVHGRVRVRDRDGGSGTSFEVVVPALPGRESELHVGSAETPVTDRAEVA